MVDKVLGNYTKEISEKLLRGYNELIEYYTEEGNINRLTHIKERKSLLIKRLGLNE